MKNYNGDQVAGIDKALNLISLSSIAIIIIVSIMAVAS